MLVCDLLHPCVFNFLFFKWFRFDSVKVSLCLYIWVLAILRTRTLLCNWYGPSYWQLATSTFLSDLRHPQIQIPLKKQTLVFNRRSQMDSGQFKSRLGQSFFNFVHEFSLSLQNKRLFLPFSDIVKVELKGSGRMSVLNLVKCQCLS